MARYRVGIRPTKGETDEKKLNRRIETAFLKNKKAGISKGKLFFSICRLRPLLDNTMHGLTTIRQEAELPVRNQITDLT